MRMVDLIQKKRDGFKHSEEEIHYIVKSYVDGQTPDYQMSAWMMAVCFQGLDKEETAWLTREMMYSGDIVDLSQIEGITVDKHSTGGVGDKTSLVLCPMVAACGLKVAKMSGRGLGHTGGTLDKLESIDNINLYLNQHEFIKQVNDIGFALIGQSGSLVPADKKMYALRDVTATVSCIPLIASSIMSKKLASGTDVILLDVKYGEGAFMKTKEDASVLAKTMIDIGTSLGRNVRAALSNMNQPLGNAIGNGLEVIEAIETLNGQGPKDLLELCLQSGSHMLVMANQAKTIEEARVQLIEVINNKSALHKLKDMVKAQGGNADYIINPALFKKAKHVIEVKSSMSGYIKDIAASSLGVVSMKLGGGRETKDDVIDYSVGLVLNKKVSDYVCENETLLYVHTNNDLSKSLLNDILNAYTIVESKVDAPVIIESVLE